MARSRDAASSRRRQLTAWRQAGAAKGSLGLSISRELTRLLARHNRQPGSRPVLELNMRHPIVQALAQAKEAAHDAEVADLAALLLEEATILDGELPDDPAAFAARVNRLVARGLPAAG